MAITLAEVETAITGIQTNGQSFTIDGIQYTAANLSALVKLRTAITRDAGRAGGTRPTMRAVNFTGMGY